MLLLAFPHDSNVAKICANEIRTQQYPFLGLYSGLEAWRILAQDFRDNPEVIAAINEWAPRQDYHNPEVAEAALVGRTPTVKQKLISSLKTRSFPYWAAWTLLEGWGITHS